MSRDDDIVLPERARRAFWLDEQTEQPQGRDPTPGTRERLAVRRLIADPVALPDRQLLLSHGLPSTSPGCGSSSKGGYQDHRFSPPADRPSISEHLAPEHATSALQHLPRLGEVKLPLGMEEPTIVVCWVGAGLVLVMSTYLLLCELFVPRWVAFGVTLLGVVLSPAYVLAENWMYLAYPTAALLALTGLLLARAMRTGRTWYVVGFSASASAVVLLNSTYQWIWLVPVGILALLGLRHHGWRTLLIPLMVPVVVVGLGMARMP